MGSHTQKGIEHFIYGAGIDTSALSGNIAKKGMIFSYRDPRKILLTDVC